MQTKVINCNSAKKKLSLTSCAHKSYRSFDAILWIFQFGLSLSLSQIHPPEFNTNHMLSWGDQAEKKTSSAIAEIDDRPHGASTHYIIRKPWFFNFQNFLKRDRQTKTPIKTSKNLYIKETCSCVCSSVHNAWGK